MSLNNIHVNAEDDANKKFFDRPFHMFLYFIVKHYGNNIPVRHFNASGRVPFSYFKRYYTIRSWLKDHLKEANLTFISLRWFLYILYVGCFFLNINTYLNSYFPNIYYLIVFLTTFFLPLIIERVLCFFQGYFYHKYINLLANHKSIDVEMSSLHVDKDSDIIFYIKIVHILYKMLLWNILIFYLLIFKFYLLDTSYVIDVLICTKGFMLHVDDLLSAFIVIILRFVIIYLNNIINLYNIQIDVSGFFDTVTEMEKLNWLLYLKDQCIIFIISEWLVLLVALIFWLITIVLIFLCSNRK